tara:strand:- start:25952 stop:26785 length:834 start_codon:yes stop_codon:yes gene_type:complete
MDTVQNKKFYAIVLSYDENHIFVDNLLFSMKKFCFDSDFIYRIPYNIDKPTYLKKKYHDLDIEFIKTHQQIKKTVLSLIYGLNDEDWIYWCIDDKFPVALKRNKVYEILNFLKKNNNPNFCGITFSRTRYLKHAESIDNSKTLTTNSNIKLLKRTSFNRQFWLHQFFRVKIIRKVFDSFPNHDFQAKEMDKYISKIRMNENYEFYVTRKNYVVFCESSRRGIASHSLMRSLKESGISNYSNKEFSNKDIIIGHLDSLDCYMIYLKYIINKFKNILST